MAMLQSLILQRVRDLLGDNPWQSKATATDGTTSTITPTDATRWDEGAIMEFQDQGEQLWVQVQNTSTVTALRAINGTTGAAHSGIVVYRDPTFSFKKMVDSIELIAQSLWPQVYKVATTSLTWDATTTFYNLPATVMGIIEVNQQKINGTGRVAIYGPGESPVVWNLPTAVATNTIGMAFPNGFNNTTNAINVVYAAKYTATQTTAGTYADFVDGDFADMVAHGAAARLLRTTETARVNMVDIGMGDSSVTPGSRLRLGELMWQIYLDKKRQFQQQLLRISPLRGNEEGQPYLSPTSLMPGYTTSPPWS